ncbi:hypothetical protein [Pseudogemmobacter sp. W21_MBD1_M6]|uniref:hypothetical protein n=1 Tax=Pseudogemmobacter sp. W21_MBD1_M6 TaxID=3240271 RepID=UPI003F9EB0C3
MVQENLAIAGFENLISMLDGYRTIFPTLDDLSTQFGNDPTAAFAYVRDMIRTEPYVGTLRSPMSVIAASGGNTQDKSELLMVLLRKMGLDARIAEAPLTDAMAEQLRVSSCGVVLTADENIGTLIGLSEATTIRAIARAQRDYGRLLDAVPSITDATPALSAQFGDRHYWVQYRDANGWRDLDPSVPDMQAGAAMAPPEALSEGGANPHLVTVSVVIETLRDGKLREQSVLTQEFAARDADEKMIQLGFTPAGAGIAGVLSDKLLDAIDLSPKLKPVLIVDFIPTLGKEFSQPSPLAAGGLSGTSQEDAVTAVWLDIRSVAPEGITRTARRAVMDLLPFAERQSNPISPDAILNPVAGVRYPQALEGVTLIVTANGGMDARNDAYRLAYIQKTWNETLTTLRDGTTDPELLMWINWTAAHSLATGAERTTRDLRTQDGKTCGYYGHANVMLSSLHPVGQDAYKSSIDWAIDGIDLTSAIADPDPRDLQALRLWYGSVRSAIETEWVASGADASQAVSTSILLDGPLMRLPPDAVAKMGSAMAQRDQENGYLLMGAANGASSAWWRVDPTTGATDARLSGLGNNAWTFGLNYVSASKAAGEIYVTSKETQLYMALARRTITDRQFAQAMKALNYYKNLGAKRGQQEYQAMLTIGFLTGAAVGSGVGLGLYIKFSDAWGYRHVPSSNDK